MKKHVFGALAVAAVALGAGSAMAQEKIKIGFLPGVVDPFYQVMEIGVNKAAADLGIEVVTQIPPTWGVEVQTPILDALIARGDLDYIITAPTDKDQMIGPLQAAVDAGIKVITVDTFLGDGDYGERPGQVPAQLHRLRQRRGRPHLGPRPRHGDRRQGQGLHQLHQPERQLGRRPRAVGFQEVMKNEFPDIEVVGLDFNLDDPNTATTQTAAVLAARARSRRRLRHQRVQRPGRRQRGDQCRPRRPGPGRRLRCDPGRHRDR